MALNSNKIYVIDFGKRAKRELNEIIKYIEKESASHLVAQKAVQKIFTSLERLEKYPESCELVQVARLKIKRYHKMVVDDILIFYSVNKDKQAIKIVRVFRAKQDWIKYF